MVTANQIIGLWRVVRFDDPRAGPPDQLGTYEFREDGTGTFLLPTGMERRMICQEIKYRVGESILHVEITKTLTVERPVKEEDGLLVIGPNHLGHTAWFQRIERVEEPRQ